MKPKLQLQLLKARESPSFWSTLWLQAALRQCASARAGLRLVGRSGHSGGSGHSGNSSSSSAPPGDASTAAGASAAVLDSVDLETAQTHLSIGKRAGVSAWGFPRGRLAVFSGFS